MDWTNILIQVVLPIITLVFGWFSGKKKSTEEVKQMQADYSDKILKTNETYIVEPLIKETNALRREVKKLNKAINKIADCPHADNCPIRDELQKHETSND